MRKYLYGLTAFVLAFVILSVSFLRSASLSPAYGYSSPAPTAKNAPSPNLILSINYFLPYPGGILPDNWLWYFKAIRDRMQYLVTGDHLRKADLNLLYSDKRLGASLTLFENKKPDIAATTLVKGEKYLEEAAKDEEMARKAGINTNNFLIKLANASLKHRQIIEEDIISLAPEDIKPEIVKAEDYSKNTYKVCRDLLNSAGIAPPKDPFNGQ
jgi:hypothetical protein